LIAIRGLRAVFVLAPLILFAEGAARADEPDSLGPGLRPYIHTDRYGRTLVDVCPERTFGGPRCYSQRIIYPDTPRPPIIPFSGGGSCTPMGGGGYGSVPPGTMTPKDIVAAYKIPATAVANGAIVALAELPSTHAMSDLNTYRAAFGIAALPACPTDSKGVPKPGGTACFARVGTDGTVNTVSSTDCPGWAGETGLDMDMVSAACPDCSIVVVEGDPTTFNLPEMNYIASSVIGAAAISNSWGSMEYSGEGSPPDPFVSATALAFAASGDNGYDNEAYGWGTPSYPASDPHVISVGGTTLHHTGSDYSEVVWDDGFSASSPAQGAAGSGCSLIFAMPTYQTASGISFGACAKRASTDLSAAAEFCPPAGCGYGGIAAFDVDDGGWAPVVGTSAASPLVAAIMVRVGLAGKDNHQLYYSNAGAFNDVTSGNNDPYSMCGGTIMCTAGKGWDGPTGLGTPNGEALFALAGGVSPPPPDSGAPPPTDGGGPPPTDGGTGGPDGSKPPPPPGTIGAPCQGQSSCDTPLSCVSSASGKDPVCAPSCNPMTKCPTDYECKGGFCFAAPPPATKSSDPKNNTGCGCTTASQSSPWAGVGWLTLGLLAFTRRRRAR